MFGWKDGLVGGWRCEISLFGRREEKREGEASFHKWKDATFS